MKNIIAFFAGFLLVAVTAKANVIGGAELGWQIDFNQLTATQKKAFGWFDDEVKTNGFKKFSNTYSVPGVSDWTLAGKVIALHAVKGPAFFSITELLNDSKIEDIKKTHYRVMSDVKGFKEGDCVKTPQGAQSCEVFLNNWSPPKAFYAVFYEWKTAEKTFVLVVRNAQASPDRKTAEEAAQVFISNIK